MNKIRIGHFSDFHFGRQNKYIEDFDGQLLKTLDDIIKISNSVKAKVLLVAGDFFDSSNITSALLKDIKEVFSDFKGRVFMVAGNHDFISMDSPYNTEWPKNVYIFKNSQFEFIELEDVGVRVYGYSFDRPNIQESAFTGHIDLDDRFINICLIHGDLASKSDYNPISTEDIANSGFDYIALGHIHKRSQIYKEKDTFYAYSGNPFGSGFDELGDKGIYLGEIYKGGHNLNFYKSSSSSFIKDELVLDNIDSQLSLVLSIEEFLKEKYGDNYKKNFYSLTIKGKREKNFKLNKGFIEDKLAVIRYIEVLDKTNIEYDYATIAKEPSIRGFFAKRLMVKMDSLQGESRDYYKKVLDLGLSQFED